MMTVEVIEDRFADTQGGLANAENVFRGSNRDKRTVRRPVRGITLKEDTFATMRVVSGDGKNILLTDAAGSKGSPHARQTSVYSNFLLQQVSEERMEKQQILETFGEPYIFLFGERPRMISFSGVLMNTFDFNWEAEWWENYDQFLRGTRCVENDARVFIAYDETLVSGYIIASTASKNTQEPNHVQFQFTMFLTGYTNFSDIGDGTAIPLRARERAKKVKSSTTGDDIFQVSGPKALVPGQNLTGNVTNGSVDQPSLADGLKNGLSTVINTWSQAQSIVNNAVQSLANLARGDILRVPFGFAGVMAYDSVDLVRDQQTPGTNGAYGVVKFSEFKDNTDEFIGASSHYGSALVDNPISSDIDSQKRNQQLVQQAKNQWLEAGFLMPTDNEAEVASFIIRNGVGMIPAGNTQVWQAAQTADTGLSAINMSPVEAARSVSPVSVAG